MRRWWWWTLDYAYAGWWQARSLLPGASPEAFREGERRPIVVIPGVYETWRFLLPLVARLHAAGHPVHVMPRLRHNRRPVAESAGFVADLLEERDLHDVVIVAHSKGGLIGKSVMADTRVAGRVSAMVAVSTPFSGSRYALLMLVPSLRAFSPYAPTTVRLAREMAVNTRIRSVFGAFDPHIPEGSHLPGAENERVDIGGHFRILGHPRTIELVLDAAANGVDARELSPQT
ncbi:alpha/beta hydrolase [Salinibacterium sp. SYSU T00001]|nr:alpha/beta hydrolase [Salinibacterium sedimenticola]